MYPVIYEGLSAERILLRVPDSLLDYDVDGEDVDGTGSAERAFLHDYVLDLEELHRGEDEDITTENSKITSSNCVKELKTSRNKPKSYRLSDFFPQLPSPGRFLRFVDLRGEEMLSKWDVERERELGFEPWELCLIKPGLVSPGGETTRRRSETTFRTAREVAAYLGDLYANFADILVFQGRVSGDYRNRMLLDTFIDSVERGKPFQTEKAIHAQRREQLVEKSSSRPTRDEYLYCARYAISELEEHNVSGFLGYAAGLGTIEVFRETLASMKEICGTNAANGDVDQSLIHLKVHHISPRRPTTADVVHLQVDQVGEVANGKMDEDPGNNIQKAVPRLDPRSSSNGQSVMENLREDRHAGAPSPATAAFDRFRTLLNQKAFEKLRLLLQEDLLDVNCVSGFGKTPLMLAAHNGHRVVCEMLLQHRDISVLRRSDTNATALHFAAAAGHAHIHYGRSAWLAANVNSPDVVRVFCELCGVENLNLDQQEASTGHTLLLKAVASGGQTETVKYLLTAGSNVLVFDKRGRTALGVAAALAAEAKALGAETEIADARRKMLETADLRRARQIAWDKDDEASANLISLFVLEEGEWEELQQGTGLITRAQLIRRLLELREGRTNVD
eukprot:g16613.t1